MTPATLILAAASFPTVCIALIVICILIAAATGGYE